MSYLPQHYRIISRRSSEGISPYFVLLGTTSGTCGFANILTLPASRADLACCRVISGFECFAGLLGVAQVGVQWACFWFMYVQTHCFYCIGVEVLTTHSLLLFLTFFPRATPHRPLSSTAPTHRLALSVTLVCLLHLFLTILVSVVVLYFAPAHLSTLAAILGILATILAAIQYLPQIYTTWRLQKVGSLSIPMMCIQTPGSFVWVASLAARLGWAGWSTWGIYAATGCLQGVLLVMAIRFEIREWRERKSDEGATRINGHANVVRHDSEQIDERSGLLTAER